MSWFRRNDPSVPLDKAQNIALPEVPEVRAEPAPREPNNSREDGTGTRSGSVAHVSASTSTGQSDSAGNGQKTNDASGSSNAARRGGSSGDRPARGRQRGRGGNNSTAPVQRDQSNGTSSAARSGTGAKAKSSSLPNDSSSSSAPKEITLPSGLKVTIARSKPAGDAETGQTSSAAGPSTSSRLPKAPSKPVQYARIDADESDDEGDQLGGQVSVQGQSGTALAKEAQFVGAGTSVPRSKSDRGRGGKSKESGNRGPRESGGAPKSAAPVPAQPSPAAGASAASEPFSESQQQTRQPQPRPRPPVKPIRPEDQTPLSRDLSQLKVRFPTTQTTNQTDTLNTVRLSFTPTDPDFPYDLPSLNVELRIPSTYPIGFPRLTVLTSEIPANLRRKVEEGWDRFAGANARREGPARLSLVGLVNWLDRKLEELLVAEQGGSITGVVRASDRKVEEKPAVSAPQPSTEEDESSSEEESSDEEGEDDAKGVPGDGSGRAAGAGPAVPTEARIDASESDDEDDLSYALSNTRLPAPETYPEETAEEEAEPSASGPAISTEHRGTQIRLPNVHRPGIALLQPARLSLVLRCARCRTNIDAPDLQPDHPVILPCRTCRSQVGVRLRAGAVHSGDPLHGLAYLDLENCTVVDLLPASSYTPTCEKCGEPNASLFKGLDRDETVTAFCNKCHGKMDLKIGDVRFVKLVAGAGVSREGAEERAGAIGLPLKQKKPKDTDHPDIIPGKPLPKHGACSHYSKSFRWFRFPCCGRVYPCDLCHEAGKPDNHLLEWATRMVCGHCAYEQRYHPDAPCSRCGGDLKRKGGAGFWEGGKGTRDQGKMNRKDTKKYRGIGKTESKKSERVGRGGKA